jgi:hypothetical protein
MASTTGAEKYAGLQPDLEKTTSRKSHSNVPPPELLSDDADAELLGKQLSASSSLSCADIVR